jgi:hypothetical protein
VARALEVNNEVSRNKPEIGGTRGQIDISYQGDKRDINTRSNGVGTKWGGMWFMWYWNERDIKWTIGKNSKGERRETSGH